jgi:hypothetical protein
MKPDPDVEVVVMVRQRFGANGCSSFELPVDGFMDGMRGNLVPQSLVDAVMSAFVQAGVSVVAFNQERTKR